jgi:hypothetical protein
LAASVSVASSPANLSESCPLPPLDVGGGVFASDAVWLEALGARGAAGGGATGAGGGAAATGGGGELGGIGPIGETSSGCGRGATGVGAAVAGGAGAACGASTTAGGGAEAGADITGGEITGPAAGGGKGGASGARAEGGFAERRGVSLTRAAWGVACVVEREVDARGAVLRGAELRGGRRLGPPVEAGGCSSMSLSVDGRVRRPRGVDGLKLRRVEPEFISGTLNSGPSESSTLISTVTERLP